MGHGLRALRSEYVQEFKENEGTFYIHDREAFLNALSRYVTWKFLSETIMGSNPWTFEDEANKLGLERNLMEYYTKRNGNNHNGNGNNGRNRILKILEKKKSLSIQ